MKGFFITIEGGEGVGKTSFASLLVQELILLGLDVIHTREPGGSYLGEVLRPVLLKQNNDDLLEKSLNPYAELYLFLALRSQHLQEIILPSIKDNKIVICERYIDSTIVYQGVAGKLNASFVEKLSLDDFFIFPDKTFLLDLSPEIGLKRKQQQHVLDYYEKKEITFHKKVREGFLKQANKYKDRFSILDASIKMESVIFEALKILKPLLICI